MTKTVKSTLPSIFRALALTLVASSGTMFSMALSQGSDKVNTQVNNMVNMAVVDVTNNATFSETNHDYVAKTPGDRLAKSIAYTLAILELEQNHIDNNKDLEKLIAGFTNSLGPFKFGSLLIDNNFNRIINAQTEALILEIELLKCALDDLKENFQVVLSDAKQDKKISDAIANLDTYIQLKTKKSRVLDRLNKELQNNLKYSSFPGSKAQAYTNFAKRFNKEKGEFAALNTAGPKLLAKIVAPLGKIYSSWKTSSK